MSDYLTVKELIARLQSAPPEARVLIRDEQDSGNIEYADIESIKVQPLAEYWCYGCAGFIAGRGLKEPPSPGAGKSGWFAGPDEFDALVLGP